MKKLILFTGLIFLIILVKAQNYTFIAHVVDEESLPVEGADVIIDFGETSFTGLTDSNGIDTIIATPSQMHNSADMIIHKEGYRDTVYRFTGLQNNHEYEHSFVLIDDFVFGVYVYTIDLQNDTMPLYQAQVIFNYYMPETKYWASDTLFTNDSGFVFFNLSSPPDSGEVNVTADGYYPQNHSYDYFPNEMYDDFEMFELDTVFEFMWVQSFEDPTFVEFYPIVSSPFEIDTLEWNFSDDQLWIYTGVDTVLAHQFPGFGTYLVKMQFPEYNLVDSQYLYIEQLYPDSIECVADFDYFPIDSNPESFLYYQFINLSYGENLDYYWDFGDGFDSQEKDPAHVYNSGQYDVTLIATNGTCSDTLTLPLWASDNEEDIWYPDTCQALFYVIYDTSRVVHFIDMSYASSEIIERHWDFGDGSEAYSVASPLHQYAEDGNYTVTYEIQDFNGGYSSFSIELYVDENLDSCLLFFPDSVGGNGKAVSVKFHNLTDDDGSEWVWNFGDSKGSYKGSKGYVEHTYANAGEYHVTAIKPSTGSGYAVDIFVGNDGSVIQGKAYAIKGNMTGIRNIDSETIKTYPNPATRILNIQIASDDSRVTIYSVDGKKVIDRKFDKGIAKIDVTNLSAGTYTVQVQNKERIYTGKFVK